jgi:hypothetical protein
MSVKAQVGDAIAWDDSKFRETGSQFFATLAELRIREGAVARNDSCLRAEDVDGAM